MADAKNLIGTIETKIPKCFGLTPKAKIIVKRLEAFREKSAGKAFYQSLSKDGSVPDESPRNIYKKQ
jgi:uncharacterized protein (DUF885 family)